MTKPQEVTAYFIFVAVVLILVYDCAAFVHGGTQATISWVIWQSSQEYPIIPFGLGLLMGHLLGQMKVDKKNET